jgi:ribosomal protein L11 methyltransferase
MSEAMNHLRWRLEVPTACEEALTERLWNLGASATYREADPPYHLMAYFPPGVAEPEATQLSAFPGVRLLNTERFRDEDWLAKSREGFGAFEVGRRFFIKPVWDTNPGPSDRIPIRVNPGLAFGTGGHETTRLCMQLLEDLAQRGELRDPVLDIGAGTGILALAAHLLGAEQVTAFDNDPDCGPALQEFIELNENILRHSKPYAHFVGHLDDARLKGPYRLLLANILLETIQMLLPRIAEIAAPGALLIASGILAERQDEALVSLALHGFKPLKVNREGEWIAILAQSAP